MSQKDWPDWVIAQKEKGTEIHALKTGFYKYQITSKWDPEKKRAKKITGKYLGKLTPEGLIASKQERVLTEMKAISVKEFGASKLICTAGSDIIEITKKHYPGEWKEIISFAIMRLAHATPMKNLGAYYSASILSEMMPDAKVSPQSASELLLNIGRTRNRTVEFMKNFVRGSKQSIIDVTNIFSRSENLISNTLGHNADGEYIPQINLALLYSEDEKHPSFFRMVPGCIRDVSIVPTTLSEAGVKDALLVGDKGFYSAKNIQYLEENKLLYILPLKRSSSHIDYTPLRNGDKKSFNGFFQFEKRMIWHHEMKVESGRRVVLFLDDRLRVQEERDFLQMVQGEKRTIQDYHERNHLFGTIAILTNTQLDARTIYERLKSRLEIEQYFDTFKNLLHADRTYMSDEYKLEGWMLINFISMLFYYKLYKLLMEKGLLDKYSPADVILHLSRIQKLFFNEQWHLSEIPKKTGDILKKLDLTSIIT